MRILMSAGEKELQDIKKLLMLFLIKAGATSEEIGYALDIDSSRVRQILPIKKIKKFKDREPSKTRSPQEVENNE